VPILNILIKPDDNELKSWGFLIKAVMAPSPNGTQWDAQRPPPSGGLVHEQGCGTGISYGRDDAQQEPGEILKLSPAAGC